MVYSDSFGGKATGLSVPLGTWRPKFLIKETKYDTITEESVQ